MMARMRMPALNRDWAYVPSLTQQLLLAVVVSAFWLHCN